MPDELANLDRVVDLYQTFRKDGETMENSWQWACRITACLESLAFEASVQSTLDALPVA